MEIVQAVSQIREYYQGINKDVGRLKEETNRPNKWDSSFEYFLSRNAFISGGKGWFVRLTALSY